MKTTHAQQITELKRELAMRKKVYPNLVANGSLKQAERDLREAVLVDLIEMLEKMYGTQEKLFS